MSFLDDDMFAPQTYADSGGLFGRLSAIAGPMGQRANPIATRQVVHDSRAFGGPAGDLVARIRDLQQQQAAYRSSAARVERPLTDQIMHAESRGRADATNGLSTALSVGQFLRKTWIDTLAKYRPDLIGAPDDLTALRIFFPF